MEPLSATDPRTVGGFRIEARLGAGGMGQVYLGLSPAGRAVAVKVVHPALARDSEFRRRFSREAAAARAVGGIYTAPVVATGLNDDPPWLATAYVPGPSLAGLVARHGPLPEAAVWRLAAGLTEALQAVHGCGLVHRDLKPGNVLLAADGPYVIDFGISRALDGTALTTTGKVIGTPGYMSPEHAEGAQAGPASDVFSLGCVLAYAATGNAPFGGGSAASVLYRVVNGQPDLTGVPAELRGLITACLAKDPAERPGLTRLAAWISRAGPAGPAQPAGAFWPVPVAEAIRAWPGGTAGPGHETPTDRRRLNPRIAVPVAASALLVGLFAAITANGLSSFVHYSAPPLTPSRTQPASSASPEETEPSFPPSVPPTSSAPALTSPSAAAPSTPSDPLAGATTGECFSRYGSQRNPQLQPDLACLNGDFKVVQILPATTDTSACDAVSGDDWNFADSASGQVLCFSYIDTSSAYHAVVGQCVYGPSGNDTIWSLEPCRPGNFKVVGKHRDTTDASECGSSTDRSEWFSFRRYSHLNEVLCLRMIYPLIGTVPVNTCLYMTGTASHPHFSSSSCSDANVIVSGRTSIYDDPAYCGTDASFWWRSNGYPGLGFTTCYRALH